MNAFKMKNFVVSQNYFTSRSSGVRKLNKKKVKWIIKQLQKGTKVSEIADAMNITIRRVYQIKQFYEEKGRIPELKSREESQRK